jgi:drug/metabolite transporter superfamily protein YnfA
MGGGYLVWLWLKEDMNWILGAIGGFILLPRLTILNLFLCIFEKVGYKIRDNITILFQSKMPGI